MHDRNGKPLAVGDRVNVECEVTSCSSGDSEWCNVGLLTVVPMGRSSASPSRTAISLNAGQVDKIEAPATGDSAKSDSDSAPSE